MEYKARLKEMEHLVSKKKFADAVTVANTINWKKVHNINDIIVGSEAYEKAGEYEMALELLLIAHERSPIGRMILYKLSMVSVKMNDLESAQGYYNEFVQIAPHDSLKYILKYNINVAKGADNATLIKILEQLKEQDFLEDWAYELAYLYHKTNQADKCIDLCNEIVLWFGDGPVVERALELKMLYQPLDKNQEDTYRHLQQKKDGLTEISAGELLHSGEIVPQTITIPSVELPADRFNTVNLQAEIKKSIEEIMKATEKGAVNENIDAIKNLVEEIPYLQVKEPEEEHEEEKFSVNDTFQQYLEEGSDGQMSLFLPDDAPEPEKQIEGQMTIEDVLAEWDKTKRAAEAAMEEAKSKELENAKSKALREANNVLNRLEGAMSKLDAGMTSIDLLKEEYLSQPVVDVKEQKSIATTEEPEISSVELEDEISDAEPVTEEIQEEYIPSLEDYTSGFAVEESNSEGDDEEVDYKEASQMIADVNKMLQQEIDRLTSDVDFTVNNAAVEPKITIPPIVVHEPRHLNEDIVKPVMEVAPIEDNIEEENTAEENLAEQEIYDEPEPEQVNYEFSVQMPEDAVDEELEEIEGSEKAEEFEETGDIIDSDIDNFELPVIQLPEDLFAEAEEPVTEKLPDTISVTQVELEDEIKEPVIEPKEEIGFSLTDAELEPFSYFLALPGMKKSILKVMAGTTNHVNNPKEKGGDVLIVGEPGSGKTQMATNIIKVLQNKTGKPEGGIGKISGAKLNEKDIQKLYSKIQGGCLIIEEAGDISKETAVTMSLLMEHDYSGTIIILEDSKKGIDKALTRDASFAKRFTEKIVIPVFSIDELVSFAKTYANEAGFSFDEMGVLALYNRINLIARYDHPTSIREVADIMEDAMEHSQKGGLFNKVKYDKNGFIILKEKDFEN